MFVLFPGNAETKSPASGIQGIRVTGEVCPESAAGIRFGNRRAADLMKGLE
jgi:hypothetical protein